MVRYLLTTLTIDDDDVLTFVKARLYADASQAVKDAYAFAENEDKLDAGTLALEVKALNDGADEPFSVQLMGGLNKVVFLERLEVV